VPPAVMPELLHPDAPAGEREAILLAETPHADLVVLDEKPACRVAAEIGLPITGTLGVLGDGASRGLVNLPAAIGRLRKTTVRCSPALLKASAFAVGRPDGDNDNGAMPSSPRVASSRSRQDGRLECRRKPAA
jgi:hypothetical protein